MSDFSPFNQDKRPRLVVYDLDGTLVDSVPSLAQALNAMLQTLGREPFAEARIRRWVGNGAGTLVARALSADIEVDPDLDPQLHEQGLAEFMRAYRSCLTEGTALYPGVRVFLEAVSQLAIPQAVVTNKPAAFVAPILQALEIDHYFFTTVGGDSLAHKKPHPEPLLHVAALADVQTTQSLMVGDSVSDVKAARAALMPVLAVTYGYNHGEPISDSDPDWVVDALDQLLPL